MKALRTLAPALLGAALLAPLAAHAQSSMALPPGHPAIAPIAPMAQPMPPHGMGQPMDGRANVAPMGYGAMDGERANWDELRERERQIWQRERQELIRQGHGVRVDERR